MGDDGDATSVHGHHGRVLWSLWLVQSQRHGVRNLLERWRLTICVGHVLGKVLHHESLGLAFHVCSNKAGKVEIGSSIKVELVLQHLMYSIGGSTLLGDSELGDLLLAGIAGRVGSVRGQRISDMDMMTLRLRRMFTELLDDGIGIDLGWAKGGQCG